MFLPGMAEIGQQVEEFTTNTHAALIDIAMQLRIQNALTAMVVANLEPKRIDGERTATDILTSAIELAREWPLAGLDAVDGGGDTDEPTD